jgi:hypothetical protein
VWEDLDGDGVTVVGHPQQEPGVAGVEVVLRAEDGTRLATAWTGASGVYEFGGLVAGRYRVEFRAPEGFGFRDPGLASADAGQLAGLLGVAAERVVVDDLAVAPAPGEGRQARAGTARFDFDAAAAEGGGDTDGVADAAMVRLPAPFPGEGEETAAAAGEQPAPPGDEAQSQDLPGSRTDPNSQAAKPEEPAPQTTPRGSDPPPPDAPAAPREPGTGGGAPAGGEGAVP